MLLEINSYSRSNTRDVVLSVHLGDKLPDEIVSTLVSLKQRRRSYGSAAATVVYEMVLADESYSLFKAVLNSGLSPQLESDVPRVGSTVTLQDYRLMQKNPNPDQPLVNRGVFFVDRVSWKQAPKVPSQLEMFNMGITPNLVEFDHNTGFYDSEFVDSVMENSTFSVAESRNTDAGGKYIYYYIEKVGGQLDNMYEHIKWGRSLRKKKSKLNDGSASVSGSKDDGSESENEDPRCECITRHDYHQCVVVGYPLSKCDTELLFEMARDRVGDDHLVAPCFQELPASKQRWCYYWWYAVNIFHLKSKARKLPSCFVNEVRNKYGEEDGRFTGFRSTQERLVESTFN